VRLDPDKEVAWQKYDQIMGGHRQPSDDTLFGELMVEFLQYSEANNRPRTTEWYREHLASFYKKVRTVKAKDIRPFHVERWIRDRYPKTNNGNTISNAMRCVQRLMNWAAKTGRISAPPLKNLVKPATTPRVDGGRKYSREVGGAEPTLTMTSVTQHFPCHGNPSRHSPSATCSPRGL